MDIRDDVRDFYDEVARGERQGCCAPGCCGTTAAEASAVQIGYTAEQLASIPEQANLGLGCGNPTAIANLSPGESVVDLGSGAGIDAFLAAAQVGPQGRVIGVDMTPSMVSKARQTANDSDYDNVEFRLGEIEHLPVADASIDVVISNCVVNLSPDKRAVFADAYRVLRPGGRLSISDVVAIAPIPDELLEDLEAVAGCVGGAAPLDEVRELLAEVGFDDVDVQVKPESAKIVDGWMEGASDYVASANIIARKPV